MDVLGNGQLGLWKWNMFSRNSKCRRGKSSRRGSNSGSPGSAEAAGGTAFRFPLKQAVTAGALALTGDTIAQLRDRWRKAEAIKHSAISDSDGNTEDATSNLLSDHDWLRALRMSSYGFLLYGPGSFAWYRCLDQVLPKPTVQNVMLKVLLNQIVLGPCVIAAVFAWNNLWLGKLSQLPEKYKRDALPSLLYGFRFWIPVSVLNFWVVPLQARVAFMSTGSIFWNFYLSSTMSK